MSSKRALNPPAEQLSAVILAGGRARRMGGQDKGLLALGGREMIRYVIEVLEPQVDTIIINANRNSSRYAAFGYRVVADAIEGYCGPLAGMLSGMRAAGTPYLLVTPCDSPFVPRDLAARLYTGLRAQSAEIAVVHTGERMQPVFALMSCELAQSACAFLQSGQRKIDEWYAQHDTCTVDFSDHAQAFMNINTPDEIAMAERRLARRQ